MTAETAPAFGLRLRDVAVSRGDRTIVAGVTLDIATGETVLVKGPNGAVKSTLLRAVAGLAPLSAGSVSAGGGETVAERRLRIIYAGHADAAKAPLTVGENLKFWAKLYGAPASFVAKALAALDLERLRDARAAILSAGQKRRLGLARLIVSGKKIWLLDEPAASVDAASIDRLIAMIADHCAEGGAALIATHDRLDIPGARAVVVEEATR